MYRNITFLALLAGSALVGSAFAADWASFAPSFPAFPCNDGWSACIVKGERISPDMQAGDEGLARPANLRLDWASLEPTPAFSPFAELSRYTGELPAAAAVEAPAVADVEPVEDAPPPPRAASNGGSSDDEPVAAPAQTQQRQDDPPASSGGVSRGTADPVAAPADGGSMVRPPAGGSPPPADGGSMVRPPAGGSPPPADGGSMVRPPAAVVAADPVVEPAVAEAVIKPPVVVPTKPEGPETCDNLQALEPAAMMGKLTDGQVGCIEASLAGSTVQTEKDKLSRLLMSDAWTKGNHATWEKYVKRHLDEIDRSDPDLCYKYAGFLARKGVSRADGVIRWSEVALENKTRWSGETYKTRVYSLLKLRAAAAQNLWKDAEEKNAAAPSDVTAKAVDKNRNTTRVYAREWYDYAKEAGKDTTKALQLCVSAAGSQDYCEGK